MACDCLHEVSLGGGGELCDSLHDVFAEHELAQPGVQMK